jgi:hypothetical protein
MPERVIPQRTTWGKGRINVTNVVRRGISRENAQIGKRGAGDSPHVT